MLDKTFIFLLCFYFGSAKIKITNLSVPQSIELGSVTDIILDCEFQFDPNDTGIEIKWYYNGNNLLYQWIPEGTKGPQSLGLLKNIVDLDYKISNDQNTKYRALHITNISLALTGNYSCKVSGTQSEDIATKPLTVYEPTDDGLQITISELEAALCKATGAYPQPDIKLYINNENDTSVLFEQPQVQVDQDENGFNVSVILYFDVKNLTSPIVYICELEIPGTNYSIREEKIFYFDSASVETQTDYDEEMNISNSTNTTDTSAEDMQENAGIETQIEEDLLYYEFNISTTPAEAAQSSETSSDESEKGEDKNNLNESGSFKHLPNLSVGVTLLLAAVINLIN